MISDLSLSNCMGYTESVGLNLDWILSLGKTAADLIDSIKGRTDLTEYEKQIQIQAIQQQNQLQAIAKQNQTTILTVAAVAAVGIAAFTFFRKKK